ncbi:MAG: hypothetical protein HUU57_01010 [Bdellovibrio sp.]|nr:hypothetical protein [Bdellovibrio sp.]
MSSARHTALIHVALELVGGVEKGKDILESLAARGDLVSISSVYKRYLTRERLDSSARLEFVIRLETLWGVDQVLHLALSLCESGTAELTLLAFDNLILMSPRLTLPYPQMHQDPLIIRCSAEAWGHYEHPIYHKNLSEISKTAAPAQQAEFYMQGKSLVDF